jgi:hypothetical protein
LKERGKVEEDCGKGVEAAGGLCPERERRMQELLGELMARLIRAAMQFVRMVSPKDVEDLKGYLLSRCENGEYEAELLEAGVLADQMDREEKRPENEMYG